MQGKFKPLTVIMGDEWSDELEFLEPLCKPSGDTILQSTPIKSCRSCPAAGTSYNDECNH